MRALKPEDVWSAIDDEISSLLDEGALAFVEMDGVQRPVGEVRVLRGRLVIVAVPA